MIKPRVRWGSSSSVFKPPMTAYWNWSKMTLLMMAHKQYDHRFPSSPYFLTFFLSFTTLQPLNSNTSQALSCLVPSAWNVLPLYPSVFPSLFRSQFRWCLFRDIASLTILHHSQTTLLFFLQPFLLSEIILYFVFYTFIVCLPQLEHKNLESGSWSCSLVYC